MVRTKDLFMEEQIVYAQMQESIFKKIPSQLRNDFKDWQREPDDFSELMKDETFCKLYKEHKKVKDKMNIRKQQLRNKVK